MSNNASRLLSLDVFRGITVAFMIVVNSPGNNMSYAWLAHSDWNGCTLADLVFPFFIFILGVSVAYHLSALQKKEIQNRTIMITIMKRTLFLMGLGLLLNAFPHGFHPQSFRFLGVLQRIAICYLVSSLLFLTTRISVQALIMLLLILGYALLITLAPYDLTPTGNMAAYVDQLIFTKEQLYGHFFDPEGLLSTFPAIATALLGNITGAWLLSTHPPTKKAKVMTFAGFLALIAGWIWGWWLPVNKTLWTSSYVLWSGGCALVVLAFCFWLVDIKGHQRWARAFEVFGVNAIFAYIGHVLFLKIQAIIVITHATGQSNLRVFLTNNLFHNLSPNNASLLYALLYTLLWLGITHSCAIYKQKGSHHEPNPTTPIARP